VQVPGSWAPLVLIMGVFVGRSLMGFAQGARLPVGAHALLGPVMSLALGSLSGGFAARALAIKRFAAAPHGEA